jgi:hypothetical protein
MAMFSGVAQSLKKCLEDELRLFLWAFVNSGAKL